MPEDLEDEYTDTQHWLRKRCYACGHALAYAATGCPQCREHFDGRDDPDVFPAICKCKRCAP